MYITYHVCFAFRFETTEESVVFYWKKIIFSTDGKSVFSTGEISVFYPAYGLISADVRVSSSLPTKELVLYRRNKLSSTDGIFGSLPTKYICVFVYFVLHLIQVPRQRTIDDGV